MTDIGRLERVELGGVVEGDDGNVRRREGEGNGSRRGRERSRWSRRRRHWTDSGRVLGNQSKEKVRDVRNAWETKGSRCGRLLSSGQGFSGFPAFDSMPVLGPLDGNSEPPSFPSSTQSVSPECRPLRLLWLAQ